MKYNSMKSVYGNGESQNQFSPEGIPKDKWFSNKWVYNTNPINGIIFKGKKKIEKRIGMIEMLFSSYFLTASGSRQIEWISKNAKAAEAVVPVSSGCRTLLILRGGPHLRNLFNSPYSSFIRFTQSTPHLENRDLEKTEVEDLCCCCLSGVHSLHT